MGKKFLSLILALSIILSLTVMTGTASAENYDSTSGLLYKVEDGEIVITGCDSYLENVTIPEAIDGYPVTSIGKNAFYNSYKIKSVTIPGSVETIGDRAFYYCRMLENVVIEDGVKYIGDMAFQRCERLNEIIIPSSVETIGIRAFYYCRRLENIVIEDGVKYIENYAFQKCEGIESIYIPSSVESIGRAAFSDCSDLYSISVSENNAYYSSANGILFNKNQTEICQYPAGKTEISYTVLNSVTSISDRAFSGSWSLEAVYLHKNVSEIKSTAFSSCQNLININVPSENGYFSSVNGILFNKNKTEILRYPAGKEDFSYTIPSSVTEIGHVAFSGCFNLENITIPEGVEYIGSDAFSGCDNLISITIPDSVEILDSYAFLECYNLQRVTLGNGITEITEGTFSYCESLSEVEIPDGVKSIGDYAFDTCSSLKYINIPDSVESIGYSAFYWCTSLERVTIGNGVEYIADYAFSECTGLMSVTIGSGIKSIGVDAFNWCENITDVYYAGTEAQWRQISIEDGNEYLTEATIHYNGSGGETPDEPEENPIFMYYITDGAAIITGADNNGIVKLKIPEAIGGYPVTEIEANAFSYFDNLTEVTFPSSLTYIGNCAFSDCYNLKKITISENLKNIGEYAFSFCYELGDVIIPDSVETIGNCAFLYCESMEKITIGSGVKSIGMSAFSACSSLEDVYYSGTEAKWRQISIEDGNYELTASVIHYNGSGGETPDEPEEPEDSSIFDYYISDGEAIITGVDKSALTDELEIPETINGYPVTGIDHSAFEFCDTLKKVTIPGSVTNIEDRAFADCYNLKEINIPDSVTNIGNWAFAWCGELQNITIPDSVTNIGQGAFIGCYSVSAIDVSLDNRNYSSHDGVLFNKNKTVLYQYPSGKTTENYVVPDSVTEICSEAFSDCIELKSVTIPANVSEIGFGAFLYCLELTEINVATDNRYYASYDGVLFDKSKTVLLWYPAMKVGVSYTIPASVKKIEANAFSYNLHLSSVTIPEGVEEISDYAFDSCENLTNITIPKSVTNIGLSAFIYCISLTEINVASDNMYYASNDGVLFDKDETILYMYPAGKTDESYSVPESVAVIESEAFTCNEYLKNVTIPAGVQEIGYVTFAECRNLESITIPADVKSIEYGAFLRCIMLKDVYYGGTEEEWEKISIKEDNEPLLNATIHFSATPSAPSLTVNVSENGSKFVVIPKNISEGKTVILALYNSGILTGIQKKTYTGSEVEFTVGEAYEVAKVMVWKDLISMEAVVEETVYYAPKPSVKTTVTEGGSKIIVSLTNVPSGKTVVLALYDGNEFVGVKKDVYDGNEVEFTVSESYTSAKVMVWESLASMRPLCMEEI